MDRSEFSFRESKLFPIQIRVSSILALVLFFLLGSSACCLILHRGLFDIESIISLRSDIFTGSIGFIHTFLTLSWMQIVVLFLGTSWAGFLLIPGLVCFRGFSLTAMYALIFPVVWKSNFCIFFLISSLLTVVSLILLAEECMGSSWTLRSTIFGIPRNRLPVISSRRILCSAVLLIIAAVIRQSMISFS